MCSSGVNNLARKFLPGVLEKYEWSVTKDLISFMGTLTLVVMMLVIDCNNFFLKYLLWVPAEHDICLIRVLMWGFCAIATTKEWYEYITNPNMRRIGPFSWMSIYASSIETLAVIKFSIS